MLWITMRVIIFIVMVSSCRADFECEFGSRTWNSASGLTDCGISQPDDQSDWRTVSGRGYNGRDVLGGINGGFFLAWVAADQTTSIFSLPSLSLRHNSGSLSFYYKLYEPQNGDLVVSVCGRLLEPFRDGQSTDWTKASGIRVYCNGQTPEVIFTARWRRGGETRIAVDDIIVSAIDPPTTTTTTTTERPTTPPLITTTTTTLTAAATTTPAATTNIDAVTSKLAPTAAQSTSSFLPISTSITGSTPTNGTSSFDRNAQNMTSTRVVGIAIGSIIIVVLIILVVALFLCKKQRAGKRNQSEESHEVTGESPHSQPDLLSRNIYVNATGTTENCYQDTPFCGSNDTYALVTDTPTSPLNQSEPRNTHDNGQHLPAADGNDDALYANDADATNAQCDDLYANDTRVTETSITGAKADSTFDGYEIRNDGLGNCKMVENSLYDSSLNGHARVLKGGAVGDENYCGVVDQDDGLKTSEMVENILYNAVEYQ